MHKIGSHLWFDTQAKEAAEFYTDVFKNSKINNTSTLHDTPSGSVDIVSLTIENHDFTLISAGPLFKFNPSISFFVNFDPSKEKNARKNLDSMWEKLSEGGTALMPLQEYPFSKRYGWIQDKYGLSWQLILSDPKGEERPKIVPSLLFVGEVYNKAEEAINFYRSVFKNSQMGTIAKYGPGQEFDKEGAVMFADFKLLDTWFAAMDSGYEHKFAFNEAISFVVNCKNQEEIDYYWDKLSAVPEAEQCGWLKDTFGVSWQVVPSDLDKMMAEGTQEQIARVTQEFLKMKKFDLAKLKKVYKG
ncbi:MAG: VOC family protein [Patescibacteria group bacterium]|nr:MAG: VOC family protein [Patescibacteria group bacterium]